MMMIKLFFFKLLDIYKPSAPPIVSTIDTPLNDIELKNSESQKSSPLSSGSDVDTSVNEKNNLVIALYDFNGSSPDELVYKKGDILVITNWNACTGWVRGYLKKDPSKTGIFPKNYFRKYDATKTPLESPQVLNNTKNNQNNNNESKTPMSSTTSTPKLGQASMVINKSKTGEESESTETSPLNETDEFTPNKKSVLSMVKLIESQESSPVVSPQKKEIPNTDNKPKLNESSDNNNDNDTTSDLKSEVPPTTTTKTSNSNPKRIPPLKVRPPPPRKMVPQDSTSKELIKPDSNEPSQPQPQPQPKSQSQSPPQSQSQ